MRMTITERNNKLKHFITCLKCEVSGKCCNNSCSTQYDAGNMGEIIENLEAISKILEQESTTKNDLRVDCISRAEIKKIAKEMYLEVANMKLDVKTISDCISYTSSKCREVLERKLQELPSITPQEPQSFKWCTDCKEYDQEKHCCHRWSKVIRDTVEEMKQEQEPKTGYWIKVHPLQKNDEGDYMCSECKCGGLVWKPTTYCPNCGAKMVEPQENEDAE